MLVVLPILSWVVLVVILLRPVNGKNRDLRSALVAASASWGAILVLITEILSALDAFHAPGLAIAWTSSFLLLSGICVMLLQGSGRWRSLPQASETIRNLGVFQRTAAYLILGQALLLGAVALHYRPNTYDSMTYHMTRIMMWKQNQSVRHFATIDVREIHHPPFAEFVIAHLQFLSGGDRFANLVQWFAMILSALAVSLIASELGATGNVQIAASLLGTSIPMGVLQATSTQNDYVCAAWLCSFACFGMRMIRDPRRLQWIIAAGLSLGLAILTKSLAYVFGLPFCIWFGVSLLRREKWKALWMGGLIAILVVGLNLGHLERNFKLYGFIVSARVSKIMGIQRPSLATTTSNMIRFVGLNVTLEERDRLGIGNVRIATLIHAVNELNLNVLELVHDLTGLSPTDPDTSYGIPVHFRSIRMHLHEDYAGSPFHLLLILVSCATLAAGLLIRGRQRPGRTTLLYVAAVMAGYCLFCFYFRWQQWGNRFLLVHVLLWCPAVSVLLLRSEKRIALAIPILIGLLSFNWIARNMTRPLTIEVLLPGSAGPHSYFTNHPGMEPLYQIITERIMKRDCHEIGLAVGSVTYDYPLWMLFQNASYPVTIRYVYTADESAVLLDPNFRPCAVISETKYAPAEKMPGFRRGSLVVYYP